MDELTTSAEPPQPLVSAERLLARFRSPEIRIIDASWRLPGGGDARIDYAKRHIPGAVFFPIDEIADRSSDLPHMLPSTEDFAKSAGALGISNADEIVVYDDQGLFSAPRVWWTFCAMGHERVFVLDGGLPAWIAAGGPTTSEIPRVAPARYVAKIEPARVASAADIRRALEDPASRVLDARPPGRFAGRDAEPRPGLLSGAMPGARNLPASALVGPDGKLKPVAEVKALFGDADALERAEVFTSCGSGVTAAVLALALEALGLHPARLYDGSWAEWGRIGNDRSEFPVVTGSR